MAVWNLIWNKDYSHHPNECYGCRHFRILILSNLLEDMNEIYCVFNDCPLNPENNQSSLSTPYQYPQTDPTEATLGPL